MTSEPWQGDLTGGGDSALSTQETALLTEEGVRQVLVVPLRYMGLRGEARTEGIVYAAARRRVAWTGKTMEAARRIGERVVRAV